jgi:hypothetical protein
MRHTKAQLDAMTNSELLKTLKQLTISNQGLIARLDARKQHPLEQFKDKLPTNLRPGNVGELTKTYWGYFYSIRNVVLTPQTSLPQVLTISEDGAFAIKSIQKVVFERTGVFGAYEYRYLDPEIHDDANHASGLTFHMVDGQSAKGFMSDPVPMEHIGDHRNPLELKRTYAYLPNSNLEFSFHNSHPTRTYVVSLVLNGYRVRLPGQKDLDMLAY